MQILPSTELKKLAEPGPEQYLAFDELARRERNKPPELRAPMPWGPGDRTLKPIHMEWTFLQWSQHLNDEENYELQQEQSARIEELEHRLDQERDPLELEYFNAIGRELRSAAGLA